jgi:hypothetical protein
MGGDEFVVVPVDDPVPLSWQASGLLCLLWRKADRRGWIDLGRSGLRGVALVLRHADAWTEIEPFLRELIATGTVDVSGATLSLPNFCSAQARFVRRVHIPTCISDDVYARDGGRCVYCGAEDRLSLDHVIPWSRGGENAVDNLAVACRPCNSSKGARTPEEWRAAQGEGS